MQRDSEKHHNKCNFKRQVLNMYDMPRIHLRYHNKNGYADFLSSGKIAGRRKNRLYASTVITRLSR